MKRSVGLVLLVKTSTGLKVALQRRGVEDSFPGACQVAVHGRLQDHEDFASALIRESNEELGKEFTDACRSDTDLRMLYSGPGKVADSEIVTYGAVISEDRLSLIRLERTSGGIEIVSPDVFFQDLVIEIGPEAKKLGYPPSVHAMFPDEIAAVKKAFEIFWGM